MPEVQEMFVSEESEKTDELLRIVKETKNMRGEPIYENSEISLREFDPKDLHPSAVYMLEANLEFLEAMYYDLFKEGIDIFNLDQIVETEKYGKIAPPIVEMAVDEKGNRVPTIVDGIHRSKLAMYLGKRIKVVLIDGVNPDYPLIGLPADWDEVKIYRGKPQAEPELRKLRPGMVGLEDKSHLFRNLEPVGANKRQLMAWQKG